MGSSPFQRFKLLQELFPSDDQTAEVRGVHALLGAGDAVVVFVADAEADAPETVLGQRDIQGAFMIDAVVILEMIEDGLIGHVRDELGIDLGEIADVQFVMVTEFNTDVIAVVQFFIIGLVDVGKTSAETDFEIIRVNDVEAITSGCRGVEFVVVKLVLFGFQTGVSGMGGSIEADFIVSSADDFLFILHAIFFGIVTADV